MITASKLLDFNPDLFYKLLRYELIETRGVDQKAGIGVVVPFAYITHPIVDGYMATTTFSHALMLCGGAP